MKIRKVLIGLFVGIFVCGGGVATAQKANYQNNLIEIGPDNIGGRTRALILDLGDATHQTLYAGGVAGGLYVKTADTASWTYLPCVINGQELTLPISHMVQTPDNMIYIATGEGCVEHHGDNNYSLMSPKGRGMYRYNPANGQFALVEATNPANNADWEYINRVAYIQREGVIYFYAATNGGLYRWKINNDQDWSSATKVFAEPVQDIEMIASDNMAFFTSGSHLYKIGNVTGQSMPVDISESDPTVFGGDASCIELAYTQDDSVTYLYAVVVAADGLLQSVYRTTNQQSWFRLTTTTVTPFTAANPGTLNVAVAADPYNPNRVVVGGAHIWVGEGYVMNSYYQWTKASYSEEELNFGNYMGSVYASPMFVHSGINVILPVTKYIDGVKTTVYYFATDGGIFCTADNFDSYEPLNKGYNTVQFHGIAVAPDGSIIGGARDNACPFIQSRNNHFVQNSTSTPAATWYDNNPAAHRNHVANIYWFGDGGQTASSMFQQVLSRERRGIFVSSTGGDFLFTGMQGTQVGANYGRALDDYSDYTNTQTWSSGEAFLGDGMAKTTEVPQMVLWETTNRTLGNDSITFTIDTLEGSVIYRDGQPMQLGPGFQIQANDEYIVPSKMHFNYPFRYKFNHSFVVDDEMTHKVANPIASRMFVAGRKASGKGVVLMTMTPNDYSKVWNLQDAGNYHRVMQWFDLYQCDGGFSPNHIAVSNDADAVFINVVSDTTGENFVIRCSNIMSAECNIDNYGETSRQLHFEKDWDGMSRITLFDTIYFNNEYLFQRPITSMVVDPREGKDNLVITFGGYAEAGTPNVLLVKNVSNPATRVIENKSVNNGTCPVYSALVEYTTGAVYLGTEYGVFTTSENAFVSNPSWQTYGAFDGVPVTAIIQQTKNLQRERFVTHTGINAETNVFAKTKFPYAMYFATYGRGVFMDMQYVTDTTNEIIEESDYEEMGIQVASNSANTISIYPNPAHDYATLNITVENAANAMLKVYDLSGKLVYSEKLGRMEEGIYDHVLNLQNFRNGMYLININFGKQTATAKLIVR